MTDYEGRILRVLNYIHDNPGGDLSLDQLADVAAMSRFHWHRVFRALTGETCAQTVRRMRLHRAATALVQTRTRVDEIAASVGYPNPVSFARAFAEAYGQSPSAFRRANRLLPPLPPFKTGDYPMLPVEIRDEPARRLAGIAHKGAYAPLAAASRVIRPCASPATCGRRSRTRLRSISTAPTASPRRNCGPLQAEHGAARISRKGWKNTTSPAAGRRS